MDNLQYMNELESNHAKEKHQINDCEFATLGILEDKDFGRNFTSLVESTDDIIEE